MAYHTLFDTVLTSHHWHSASEVELVRVRARVRVSVRVRVKVRVSVRVRVRVSVRVRVRVRVSVRVSVKVSVTGRNGDRAKDSLGFESENLILGFACMYRADSRSSLQAGVLMAFVFKIVFIRIGRSLDGPYNY